MTPMNNPRPSPLALSAVLNRPRISSLLREPCSPSMPRSPLPFHAPPPLSQRALLPSPPLSPHLQTTAPPIPYPWIWRCHLCHTVYRLGVTRRCLEDGHYFCSLPSPPPTLSPGFALPALPGLPSMPAPRKRRSHATRGCRAEFDYSGWATYNMWRRERRFLALNKSGVDAESYLRDPDDKTEKDCWRDCDFPSECHTYLRLQQERFRHSKSKLSRGTTGMITPPSDEDLDNPSSFPFILPEEDWERESLSPSPSPSPPSPNMTSSLSYSPPNTTKAAKPPQLSAALREMELRTEELEEEVYYQDMDLSSCSSSSSTSSSSSDTEYEECSPESVVSADSMSLSPNAPTAHGGVPGVGVGSLDDHTVDGQLDTDTEMRDLRRRRKKSIMKIKQLTGLLLSEGDLGLGLGLGLGVGEFDRHQSGGVAEKEPGSPLKREVFVVGSDCGLGMNMGMEGLEGQDLGDAGVGRNGMGMEMGVRGEAVDADIDVEMVHGGRLL